MTLQLAGGGEENSLLVFSVQLQNHTEEEEEKERERQELREGKTTILEVFNFQSSTQM